VVEAAGVEPASGSTLNTSVETVSPPSRACGWTRKSQQPARGASTNAHGVPSP